MLLAIPGGFIFWQNGSKEPAPVTSKNVAAGPGKPSIVVLPFDNMSGDPKQEYFTDGITDDLITSLSKVPGLFVIARNSAFSFKGKNVTAAEISRSLQVRYILRGSVRRAGSKVRINAQLTDSKSGYQLWSEKYDGTLSDIFALQDSVTAKIVSGLSDQIKEIKSAAAETARMLGQVKMARGIKADLFTGKQFASWGFKRQSDIDRIYKGLRMAGVAK